MNIVVSLMELQSTRPDLNESGDVSWLVYVGLDSQVVAMKRLEVCTMKRRISTVALMTMLGMVQIQATTLVTELWDGVGDGVLSDLGDGSTSVGFDPAALWYLNYGTYIKVAQNFDVTSDTPDTIAGLPYNGGQQGGLWGDEWSPGFEGSVWDTRSWATRGLSQSAQINFAADGIYWMSVRINNGGDSAGGIGLASAGDATAQFMGVGAMWNNAGGGAANNSVYITDGTLDQASGPCAIRTNSAAGVINGKGLLVARVTTHATGKDKIEAVVYPAGTPLPADPANITWQAIYEPDLSFNAAYVLLWMNGTYPFEMDAIRMATTYGEVAAAPWLSSEIVAGPTNSVFAGVPVTLTVGGKGGTPLNYLWLRNGSVVATSTVPSLSFTNPVVGDSGNYTVILTNAAGVVTSAAVTLTIRPANPPVLVQGPANARRYVNGNVTFSSVVDGTPPFKYQWTHNDAPVADATNATLVIREIKTADAGAYKLFVTNDFGYAISVEASLTLQSVTANSYEERIVANKPVAYWRLNEADLGTESAMDYAGGYDLVNTNVVTSPGPQPPAYPGFSENNTAAAYDGMSSTSDAAGPIMNNMTAFTMCGWFNPVGMPQVARTSLFGQNDLAEFGFHDNGQLGIWVADGSGGTYIGYDQTANILPGNWYFVAAIADGSTVSLFLNGNFVASAQGSVSNAYNSTSPFRIGYGTIDATGNYFYGYIDEVALYDRALTGSELNAIYARAAGTVAATVATEPVSKTLYVGRTAVFTVRAEGTDPISYKWKKNGVALNDSDRIFGANTTTLTISNIVSGDQADYTVEVSNSVGNATSQAATLTVVALPVTSPYQSQILALNPVGYWMLDEQAGPEAPDYWGGNPGTYGAASVPGVPGPRPPTLSGFAATNLAVQCVGAADSWVQLPALNLNTNTVTILCWIYPEGDQGGWKGIVYSRAGTGLGLSFGEGNELRYSANNNSSDTWGVNSGLIVPTNVWSFVGMIVDPEKTTLFMGPNAQALVAASNPVTNAPVSLTGATYIGQDPQGDRFFTGVIDNVAIFNQALTPSQIYALYGLAGGYVPQDVKLELKRDGKSIILTWALGTLQEASQLPGTFTDVQNAVSPYTNAVSGNAKFFRVKVR